MPKNEGNIYYESLNKTNFHSICMFETLDGIGKP